MTDRTPLAARIRHLLGTTPREALPMTYQQVAGALGLEPPRTIQQVALALEETMREDAEAERPLMAALVVSRQGQGLPARGFFDLAVALGRFPEEPSRHVEAWQEAYRQALAARGKPLTHVSGTQKHQGPPKRALVLEALRLESAI